MSAYRTVAGDDVADLCGALALALAALPARFRYRAWLVRIERELLDIRVCLELGGNVQITCDQVGWLDACRAQLIRELPPWPRVRQAGSLARRAARSVRREQEQPVVVDYLTSLGTLLVLLARAVDGSPTVRVAWLLPRQRHRGSVVPG